VVLGLGSGEESLVEEKGSHGSKYLRVYFTLFFGFFGRCLNGVFAFWGVFEACLSKYVTIDHFKSYFKLSSSHVRELSRCLPM
jgi:hypothetical protein